MKIDNSTSNNDALAWFIVKNPIPANKANITLQMAYDATLDEVIKYKNEIQKAKEELKNG